MTTDGSGAEAGPDGAAQLAARDSARAQAGAARAMTGLTFVSRVTGFVRVVVVVVVFGRSFLGATYQAANGVPNLVFELVVAGALSSVLVPALVHHLDADDPAAAQRLAQRVLGTALVVVGAVTLVAMVLAEPVARLLFLKDPAPEKVALGRLFLLFFLPQTVLYVVAMVATGVLQAHRRFLAPVAAPIWNNLVVIAVYVGYAVVFEATAAGAVPTGGVVLLGVGTTLGVAALAFAQVPSVSRLGVRLRPRWGWRDPEVRRLARRGAWAVGYLGLNSLSLAAMNVFAQQGDNVVPLSFAYACFLLPYALFAVALSTAALPSLSRRHAAGDGDAFATESAQLLSTTSFTLLPCAVGLWLVAAPLAQLLEFVRAGAGGPVTVAFLRTFAVAVPAYGVFLALTRISYARDDTRTPTLASLVGTVVAVGVMWIATTITPGPDGLWSLGIGTAVGAAVSCVVVAVRHVRADAVRTVGVDLVRTVAAATAMAIVGAAGVLAVASALDGAVGDVVGLVAVPTVALAVYLVVSRFAGAYGWVLLRRR